MRYNVQFFSFVDHLYIPAQKVTSATINCMYFSSARILHLCINFAHVTPLFCECGFEVCPFQAETFNSYFVVYQLCILPQP